MKRNKRQIIKTKAGELGHIDCHYLSKDLIVEDSKRYYLVCVIDSCTRVAWAEVVEDIKSLSVMFATLKSLNLLNKDYEIQFSEVLTDNGGVLSAVLFNKGLIDQISLIVSPLITDKKNPKLFREVKLGKRVISLEPKEVKIIENNCIWMLMDVVR